MGAEGLRLAGEVECASGVCEKAPKVQIGPSNDLVKVDWYELLCCFVQCKLVPACDFVPCDRIVQRAYFS